MSRVVSILLILCLGCVSAFPQGRQKPVSQLEEVEPFKIKRGSSFSASTSREKQIPAKNPPIPNGNISRDFSDALEIIRNNHVDGKTADYNALTKSAIESMLHAL